ncbi:MAG TPA: dihydrodipicolinate synthase family protein [Pseudorhodoplanes sp.]|nr:dihydrodipicolinate synthase family protein [Pseudorhodoplanes sp.]
MADVGQFHGIYASTICPMRADGSIDDEMLAHHLRAVLGGTGLRGLLLNGHAGENAMLSRAEQRRVIEIGRTIGRDHLIVAGINAESSDAAQMLARDAAEAGADAIMVFAPFSWSLGVDPRVVLAHHEMIESATSLPIFLFQGSVFAGKTAFSEETLRLLLRLRNVVGIKEGSWETSAYEAVRRLSKSLRPDVAVMASGDEHLLTCFVLGSEGSLVSLAALVPELIVSLDRTVRSGDLAGARALHERIYPLAKAIYGTAPGSLATARLKACLRLLGRIERATCRAPVGELPKQEYDRLEAVLAECGLQSPGRMGESALARKSA